MKRRKGLEMRSGNDTLAFLSFTTIANDYAIVNAEEIETTGTETVQNAENNTTGGDTAATQSQQDTAAGTGSTGAEIRHRVCCGRHINRDCDIDAVWK